MLERLPERVQRARTDVAVHDPQGAERKGQQALLMAGIGMLNNGRDCASYPPPCIRWCLGAHQSATDLYRLHEETRCRSQESPG